MADFFYGFLAGVGTLAAAVTIYLRVRYGREDQ